VSGAASIMAALGWQQPQGPLSCYTALLCDQSGRTMFKIAPMSKHQLHVLPAVVTRQTCVGTYIRPVPQICRSAVLPRLPCPTLYRLQPFPGSPVPQLAGRQGDMPW
jgi:hypothetical protein